MFKSAHFNDSYDTALKLLEKVFRWLKRFFLTLVSVNAENDCKTGLSSVLVLVLKHKLVWITMEMRMVFKVVFTTEWFCKLRGND